MEKLSKEDIAQIALGLKHFCPICKHTPVITNGHIGWTYYDERVCNECGNNYAKGKSVEDMQHHNGIRKFIK